MIQRHRWVSELVGIAGARTFFQSFRISRRSGRVIADPGAVVEDAGR